MRQTLIEANMFKLLQKTAFDNGFTVKDFVEVERRRLLQSEFMPCVSVQPKLVATLYAMGCRFLDLLKKRYGSLEEAIAAGERGEAFIAQAIEKRDDAHGGLVGWIMNRFPNAAFSHPKLYEARSRMEGMGVIIHESNGRGNVGQTRINVPSLLVLVATLEDLLGLEPPDDTDPDAIAEATYYGFSGAEMAEKVQEIRDSIDQPVNPIPAIAKINKSRWKQFFGYNPRAKDNEYQYPQAIESLIQQTWSAIATVAKPVVNIPAELLDETIKYCKERAKVVIKGDRYLPRTLETEMAYQAEWEVEPTF
jgi:hypothetical protein